MIYLYIKTHNETGLKYFGKTIQDPFKYKGSGKYWMRHLKVYGNNATTEIVGCFEDIEECREAALKFSRVNDIVNSKEWANLCEENGLPGAVEGHSYNKGKKHSEEFREMRRKAMLGKQIRKGGTLSKESRLKISEKNKGKSHSQTEEAKRKIAEKLKGNKNGKGYHSEETKKLMSVIQKNAKKILCIHCSREFRPGTFGRWHGNNCKENHHAS